jgi:hypothetical protein
MPHHCTGFFFGTLPLLNSNIIISEIALYFFVIKEKMRVNKQINQEVYTVLVPHLAEQEQFSLITCKLD